MCAESSRDASAAADGGALAVAPAPGTASDIHDRRQRVRFGIRAGLLIAFAGMATMTIVATLVAWYAFSRVDLAVTRITESSVPYMSRAHAIAAQVGDITASAPELMASATQEGRERARDALMQTERKLSELTAELAMAHVNPDALAELESVQQEMTANLADLDRIVEMRLSLAAQREAVVARLVDTHRQVLENLEPAIDDAIFETVMQSEAITRSTTERIMALVNDDMLDAMRLQDIKAEANMSAGLIAQAALTGDRALLGPLEERFTASAAALARDIRLVSDPMARVALLGPVQTLTSQGTGNSGVFQARRRDLAADRNPRGQAGPQRPESAAALIGEANQVHEALLLSLTPMIDDSLFDVAIASEQTVRDSERALTRLVDGGIEVLRALLTARAEANLAVGLLVEASGVTDIDRLQPLRERFIASRDHLLKFVRTRPSGQEAGPIEQSLYSLLEFGSNSDNVFDLRHRELTQMSASQTSVRAGRDIAAQLARTTSGLVATAQKTSSQDGLLAQTAIGGGQILLLIITAIAVSGATSIILFYIAPRIVRPLVDMTDAMVRLASGDTTVEVPAQGRRDEVGQMAEAFKIFRDTAQARTNLSRYFSPRLVEELAHKDQPLGPVRRQNVAVLFADIIGFTSISESQPPEMIMALLRDFHGRMETEVFAHNGVLEKFIGDAMLATFGVPDPGEHDALDALACARAMHASLGRLNAERTEVGHAPVHIGIGLNFGPAVLGDIGSERNMAFAVIGDTTNTASRLESLTRDLACDIVASQSFVDAVRRQAGPEAERLLAGFIEGAEHKLKGREKKVRVWTFTNSVSADTTVG